MKTLTTPVALALLCAIPLTTACRELRFQPDDTDTTPATPGPDEPNAEPIAAPPFARVAVGSDRSCAIDDDGAVLCWGLDFMSAEWVAVLAPRPVSGVESATSIALHESYACALIEGAGVQCWGRTPLAAIEDPLVPPEAPFFLAGSSDVTAFALSLGRVCGVRTNGGVRCWGLMSDPEDCSGQATLLVDPFDLPGVSDATTVAVSGSATCFTRAGGSSGCYFGVPGSLFELPFSDATSLNVSQSDGCFSAHASYCAVTGGGAVDCVAGNWESDLGTVTRLHEAEPPAVALAWQGVPDDYCIEVSGGSLWCNAAPGNKLIEGEQVAISQTHACALSDSALFCWGSNEWGALGIDTATRRSEAKIVAGVADAVTIGAGASHSCATNANGELRCWGSNGQGQRGWLASHEPAIYHPSWSWYPDELSEEPQAVPGLSEASAVFADGLRSCASEVDGSVVCWGEDLTAVMSLAVPTAIPAVSAATSIASGDDSQSCAVTADGAVECWGRGWYGVRVGVETLILPAAAVEVDGDTYSACALLENGEVYCWGGSVEGTIGAAGDPLMPKKIASIEGAIDLSQSCVITAGHELVCWSFPWLPGSVEQGVPTTLASEVARIDGPCVVRDGGQVACFVDFGELDPAVDGLIDIVGAENAIDVASGSSHACALLADGHVACWGWASAGRLGDGSRTVFTEPMLIMSALAE